MSTAERPTIESTRPAAPEVSPAPAARPSAGEASVAGETGTRWKFTVEQYHRMGEAGILTDDDRVELIDGDILAMSPIGSPHAGVNKRLIALLVATFGNRALVAAGDPIRLDDRSEPQPDFSLLRPRDDFYSAAHPTPADVHVVIEVMDSSASFDRGTKLAKYARAKLPEVWLVDIAGGRIEVYRRPGGEAYDEKRTYARGESVAPEAFPDAALAVDAVLGEPLSP